MSWKIFNEGKDIVLRVNNSQLEWQYVGSSSWIFLSLISELGAIIESVNGQTGVVVLDPDDLDDNSTTHKFITQALLDQIGTNTTTITGKEDNLGNPDVDGKILSSLADGTRSWVAVEQGGHTIQDEGTPLTQRSNLDFVGDNVTVTDDSGNDKTIVTVSGGSGGGGLTYSYQTTNFNAEANYLYGVNTTNGQIIVTLPTSPNNGDKIAFCDAASTFSNNMLTINRNGKPIGEYAEDLTLTNNNESVTLIYDATVDKWIISLGG